MAKIRPVFLNLFKIYFPITAIVSILHRISGVILFFLIPILLWGLHLSLRYPCSYRYLVRFLKTPLGLFGTWFFITMLIYHFVAGMRHMLMDIGLGESYQGGRYGAIMVFACSVILSFVLGYKLW